jgi:hypothetical protein
MREYGPAIARYVVVVVLALAAPSLVSASGADRLPHGRTNFYTDTAETGLAPSSTLTSRIDEQLGALQPRVGIEISVPLEVNDEAFTDEGMLKLYNILRSISTMEGIEYYSASRDRMRIFYEESYAIDGPDSRNRIADPLVTTIPSRDRVYAFQKDSSFGSNVQRIDYLRGGSDFLLLMENTTTMVYKVVPLVTPGNLRTFVLIRPRREDGVIDFYGNIGVRVPALFGMRDRARDSFHNRIIAIHDWFLQEITAAGLTP